MNAKHFAAQMKAMIEDIKSKGTAAIYCDNIIAYLDEVQNSPEAEPTHLDIERYKADLQNWVEANKYQHEGNLEMFRSVITSGQGAIKSSLLLNIAQWWCGRCIACVYCPLGSVQSGQGA